MHTSKALILSKYVDQKSLETEFSIAICRQLATNGNRNTVSSNFDPRSSIVESVFDCRISGVLNSMLNSDARKPMFKWSTNYYYHSMIFRL